MLVDKNGVFSSTSISSSESSGSGIRCRIVCLGVWLRICGVAIDIVSCQVVS